VKIAVIAPACPLDPAVPDRINRLAAERFGVEAPEIYFHPQCFLEDGHFAGPDTTRAGALIEVANDPGIDAIWFARGGYGSNRILPLVLPKLNKVARSKTWLGYSDMGFLLAALYKQGIGKVAHGPMVSDIKRKVGEGAAQRALDWLVKGATSALEPTSVDNKCTAFNIMILSHLIGTPWMPDLSGHILMLEEVDEHLYALDRALFHITSNPQVRQVAGIRLGRCGEIPENDRPFGSDEEAIMRHWCSVSGIPYLGRADIGHDSDNKIVVFGV
jgi:muramoyltetrapeptide carboxypeptidase